MIIFAYYNEKLYAIIILPERKFWHGSPSIHQACRRDMTLETIAPLRDTPMVGLPAMVT